MEQTLFRLGIITFSWELRVRLSRVSWPDHNYIHTFLINIHFNYCPATSCATLRHPSLLGAGWRCWCAKTVQSEDILIEVSWWWQNLILLAAGGLCNRYLASHPVSHQWHFFHLIFNFKSDLFESFSPLYGLLFHVSTTAPTPCYYEWGQSPGWWDVTYSVWAGRGYKGKYAASVCPLVTSVTPHYVFIGAETRRTADTSRYRGDQIREFLKKLGDCCDWLLHLAPGNSAANLSVFIVFHWHWSAVSWSIYILYVYNV